MIVIKFGGTSVGTPEALRQAIEIVAAAKERRPIVVVSALSGITNQLVEATEVAARGDRESVEKVVDAIRQRHEEIAFTLVQQKSDYLESFMAQLTKHTDQISDILRGLVLVGEVSPRAKDKIVAIGEKLSSVLFSYTMRLKTLKGVHVDSEEVVVTDDHFGEAVPQLGLTRETARRILLPEIEREHIPVMGGFIGRSTTGATTTLGRGGSDYSAAIIGAAVGAEEIQIWTDVDGMMTCDPRVIKAAKIIDLLSYAEAAELAYFGAKVLHPKTIWPAVEQSIPIRVLNTHNVDSPGTLITAEGKKEKSGPRAIAIKKEISIVHMTSNEMLGAHGFLAKIFDAFARLEIPVDLITTSEVSVSVTVDEDDRMEELLGELRKFATVNCDKNQAIIAIVGKDLMGDSAVGASIFSSLAGLTLSMISLGRADLNLSLVMDGSVGDTALMRLHKALFESTPEEAA